MTYKINIMTIEYKQRIIEAVKLNRANYNSDTKHAVSLDISNGQYTRAINNGEIERVLSNAKWISIARKLNVQLHEGIAWKTVKTETYNYISAQLQACQTRSISAIFCDIAGIGKTHTSKQYVSENKNAVYIDCSQVKSKQKLIRKIAQEFGVNHTGRYTDVYDDLMFYVKQIEKPLIILDEAGDLSYPAFLELKACWNATEYTCGWYMMGADGLEHKIKRQKDLKKVGYTEIFDRYGNGYKRVTPIDASELKQFHRDQIAKVSKANESSLTVAKMFGKTQGSLRKVRIEIEKQRLQNG